MTASVCPSSPLIVDFYPPWTTSICPSTKTSHFSPKPLRTSQILASTSPSGLPLTSVRLSVPQEAAKPALRGPGEAAETRQTLLSCAELGLRLLAPFAPFLAEELWQRLPRASPASPTICFAPFPDAAMLVGAAPGPLGAPPPSSFPHPP